MKSRGVRYVLVLLAALAVAGCARYTLLEPRPTTLADLYEVDPQIAWSATSHGKWEIWTVDGPNLEALQFLKGLADGEPLFAAQGGEKRARFDKTMSPNEIVEFIVDSLAATGAQKVQATGLRPAKFGNADGFRFELSYQTQSGLSKKAIAAGAVVKEHLYLIVYSGLAQHYFPKHRDHAEAVIRSVRMK